MAIQRADFPLPDVDDALTAPFFAAAARRELRDPALRRVRGVRLVSRRTLPDMRRHAGMDPGLRPRHVVLLGGRPRARSSLRSPNRFRSSPRSIALDEDPFVRVAVVRRRRRPDDADRRSTRRGRLPRAALPDGARPFGDRADVPPGARMIYHVGAGRRSHARHRGRVLRPSCSTDLGADVVFTTPITDPLFTYLRTSQHHTPDPTPWLDAADIVLVGEPGVVDGTVPLVTVSVTPLGHGGPDDGLDLPEEVLQARSGSLSAHGHTGRPPLTVGGNLGEYVTGAFAALGAATAWWRASRTGIAETRRRFDARSDAADVRHGPDRDDALPRRPADDAALGDDPGQRAHRRRALRRDHDRHRRAVARALPADGPRRPHRRRRAHDDDGSRQARRRGERDPAHLDARAHRRRGRRARVSTARVPATIVGNGAELPRFEQLAARDVFVRQPGEDWIRPRAPFRFHGVADRELVAVDEAGPPWPRDRPRRESPDAVGERPLAGLQRARLHRVLGRTVRHRVAGRARCGRDQGRSGAAARRDPVQRRGATQRRPAVLREVRPLPCREPRQARHHAGSRPSRRARARRSSSSRTPTSSSRTSRRGSSSSSGSTTRPCGRCGPTS